MDLSAYRGDRKAILDSCETGEATAVRLIMMHYLKTILVKMCRS